MKNPINAGQSEQRRQISKLIRLLVDTYDASTISPTDIADCLECPIDVVENQLVLIQEQEGILESGYVLYCGLCDKVMAHYKSPNNYKGYVECPYCSSQPECVSIKDFVRVYAVYHKFDWDSPERWVKSDHQIETDDQNY